MVLAAIREKQYMEEGKLFRLREAQRSWNLELGAKSKEQKAQSRERRAKSKVGRAASSLHKPTGGWLYALSSMPYALSCLEALSQETSSQKETLRELQREALKAKEELLEASKSRKIVEKLRDRELERHRKHVLQQERKYLDEIAAGRFARNRAPYL